MQLIRNNLLVIVLTLVVLYFVFQSVFGIRLTSMSVGDSALSGKSMESMDFAMPAAIQRSMDGYGEIAPIYPEPAPVDSPNRLVIQDTSLSLVVNEVESSISQISQIATTEGGFLVNSNLSKPEGAASGMITIRVPIDKRDQVLEQIKQLGVNVVSESIDGRDVTDQYEDIEERLAVLNQTKVKFQEILNQATEVQDLLQVQRELISLQSQIDNLKGRQEYLTQSAQLTRISVYLSTDELSLPYAPDNAWRPQVVFKQAVRNLIGTLRVVGNLAIYAIVFSVIFIPLGIGAFYINKFIQRRKHASGTTNH